MKCPLCHKELIDKTQSTISGFIWQIYECGTRVKFEGKTTLPHFKRIDMGGGAVEDYWWLPPYEVVWTGKQTLVGIVDGDYVTAYTRRPKFKTVFTTPDKIHPDRPEKLLERLKLLTLLS